MLSRGILVIAAGHADHYKYTLPRLAELSEVCQASLVVHRPSGGGYDLGRFAWLKLEMLHSMAAQFEHVLVLDSDILPNPLTFLPEDAQALFSGSCFVRDHGLPLTDEIFVDWCRRKMPRPEHVQPPGRPYYNSGVFSLPRMEACAAHYAWQRTNPATERFHDQDFLNWHINDRLVEIRELPLAFNWMAPQVKGEAVKEAKLIHFAGAHKSLIREYDRFLPRFSDVETAGFCGSGTL